MKFAFVVLVSLLGSGPGATADDLQATKDALNPASRVVQLLKDLSVKLEKSAKAEEDLYEGFKCWCDKVMHDKKASVNDATSRIDSLKAYIADVEAGKVEFTTERMDLEKQKKELELSIQTALTLREQEKKDWEAADEEMHKAIEALKEAISTIEVWSGLSLAQTSKPKLLGLRWELRKALDLGRGALSKSDQQIFERLLDGQEPEKDWKKLNRKATFKKKYAASSGKILEVLKSMLETFTENKDEAAQKEKDAEATFKKIMAAKEDMLDKTEQSLVDMVKEGAAKGLTLQEAEDEISDLEAQVTADEKFQKETVETCDAKEKEFSARKTLRQAEITALSEAIAVLHSDDARDKMRASHARFLLLQLSAEGAAQRRAGAAMAAVAAATHDPRLMLLARLAQTENWKDGVITQIDKLVTILKTEESEDLKKKEDCEKTMADLTRDAKTKSITIDETTDAIAKDKQKVQELLLQIQEQEELKVETNKTMKTLEVQREDEHLDYKKTHKDDADAIDLLEEARLILKQFYEANALLAKKSHLKLKAKMDPVVGGEAPPPPPATWENPGYEVASGQSKGIQTILQLIIDDLTKDMASAKKGEEAADKAYQEQRKQLEEAMADSDKLILEYNGDKAKAEADAVDLEQARATDKDQLDSILKQLKTLTPGCDYIAINFQTRVAARNAEIDGLDKAKAIILGAKFD